MAFEYQDVLQPADIIWIKYHLKLAGIGTTPSRITEVQRTHIKIDDETCDVCRREFSWR